MVIFGHRGLWVASACNALALWMVQIAVSVHVLQHHTVATLAVVGLIGSLPALVCTPFAGRSRRPVRRALGHAHLDWRSDRLSDAHGSSSQPGAADHSLRAPGHVERLLAARKATMAVRGRAQHQRHPANAAIGWITGLMTLAGATLGGLLSSWDPCAAFAGAAATTGRVELVSDR